jgi:hypothetical protein
MFSILEQDYIVVTGQPLATVIVQAVSTVIYSAMVIFHATTTVPVMMLATVTV